MSWTVSECTRRPEVLITRLAATNPASCPSPTFLFPDCFHGRKKKHDTKLADRGKTDKIVSSRLCRYRIESVFALQMNLSPSLALSDFDLPELDLEAKHHRQVLLFPPLFVLLGCDSLLLPVSAGRWRQAAASAGGGVSFPRSRAETGVICRAIYIFMNSVRVQTNSSATRPRLWRPRPE